MDPWSPVSQSAIHCLSISIAQQERELSQSWATSTLALPRLSVGETRSDRCDKIKNNHLSLTHVRSLFVYQQSLLLLRLALLSVVQMWSILWNPKLLKGNKLNHNGFWVTDRNTRTCLPLKRPTTTHLVKITTRTLWQAINELVIHTRGEEIKYGWWWSRPPESDRRVFKIGRRWFKWPYASETGLLNN